LPPQKVAPPCCLNSISEAKESFESITLSAITLLIAILVIAEAVVVLLIALRHFGEKGGRRSLSISAFILRMVCTNGLVAKTEVGASYRHILTRILSELPEVFRQVAEGLGQQKERLKLSVPS